MDRIRKSHPIGKGPAPGPEAESRKSEEAVVKELMGYYDSLKTQAAAGTLGGMEHARSYAHSVVPIFPDQFVYAVDYARMEVFMTEGFERVLGYQDESIDLEMTYSTIHPDDLDAVTTLARHALRLLFNAPGPVVPMNDVWSMDYRVRKANGEYIKVLRQVCVLSVDPVSGRVGSTLSICKDISNIKTSNEIGWQYFGKGPAKIDTQDLGIQMPNVMYRPSARELDILAKLAEGKSSSTIAFELGISQHTVNSHRKNLLGRTGAKNSAALIALAASHGWV